MSNAVFLRALNVPPEEKGRRLQTLIEELRQSTEDDTPDGAFTADTREFDAVPGSPFAYWVGEGIRRIFREFPPLEGSAATVKQGLATADDFRFVRAWWEIAPERIGYSASDTLTARGWIHFAKGGSYSPYYADVHLVVNWFGSGAQIRNRIDQMSGNPRSNIWMLRRTERDYFFRLGLTWPRRADGLSFRVLPAGGVFADKGPAAFEHVDDEERLLWLLGVLNSPMIEALVRTMLARTELAQSYEIGVIANIPLPTIVSSAIAGLAKQGHDAARALAHSNEIAHCFRVPSVLLSWDRPIDKSVENARRVESELKTQMASIRSEIADSVFELYRVPRRSNVLEHVARPINPGTTEHKENKPEPGTAHGALRVANLLMWCVGATFGRWDVRMALDPALIPPLQGPFDRLPRVAPGGLVGPDGLPATPDRIASEAWLCARPDVITLPEPGSFEGPETVPASEYPFDVAWDGILVDDEGHPRDIVARVREVLRYIYGERARAIEDEALDILRAGRRTPATLRDWFRNQKATGLGLNFFDFHVRRYSKSRRKAPIYWRLCTSPGRGQSGYGVWLYYHRLTHDTLWTVIGEYVAPRRELEERRLDDLRKRRTGAEGAEARRLEQEIQGCAELLEELEWFEAELRKVADRGYAPDPDDGVIINTAPLRTVIPWNEPGKVWRKLEKGEYDWARLAMRYWPERVRAKCEEDRSLAIAHQSQLG